MSLPGPLDGIRVLDFTWLRSGPWGTRWLGALGAEVLKVQWTFTPGQRGVVPGADGAPLIDPNVTAFSADTNSDKLSITVNVRSPKGFELVKQLVAASDVVVENFTATVLKRWGLSYEEMREINPGIVYVSMGGFGHTGPQSDYMIVGQANQALSGLTFLSGLPGIVPAAWGFSIMDDTAGIYGAMHVLTALHHKNVTGQGQHVDLAQMITGVSLTGPSFLDRSINGRPARREGFPAGNRAVWPGTPPTPNYRGPVVAPHNAYVTKGGGHNDWCAIACFSDQEWQDLVKVMGSPAWATDAKLASLLGRIEHQEEMDQAIQEWTLGLDKYEIMEKCQKAGVRAMPVQSAEDRVDIDPQLNARNMFVEIDHPVMGRNKIQNVPFSMSKSTVGVRRPAPLIGQHTAEVMERVLGLSHQEVVEGFDDGTFWPADLPRHPHMQESLARPHAGPKAKSNGHNGSQPQVKSASPGAGPLTGLRVLELADEKGQFCGKLMADLGADVIKIEPPGGEQTRSVGPFLDDIPHRDRSLYFWHYNTSKRGITLDLEAADARELFRSLATTADVVLESYSPGYMPSQGLGYDELSKLNPKLIMCSLTSFGQTGPWKDFKTCDLVHMAAGGQMGVCGYDAVDVPERPPIAGGGGQAWHTGANYAYMAITAALLARDFTGEGQYIDASIHQALALTTENAIPKYIFNGEKEFRHTGRMASSTEFDTEFKSGKELPTKDGFHATTAWADPLLLPAALKRVGEWMDEQGLGKELLEEVYQTPEGIAENRERIYEIIADFFLSMNANDLWHGAAKIGLPWAFIRSSDELVDDPHLRARGFYVEVEHPELGRTFTYPGAGALYNGSPWRISRRAPLVGEHNEEILCGELGLSKAKLAVLAESRVL